VPAPSSAAMRFIVTASNPSASAMPMAVRAISARVKRGLRPDGSGRSQMSVASSVLLGIRIAYDYSVRITYDKLVRHTKGHVMTNRSFAERAHEALHKSGWQNAIARFFGQRGK
jgi:hypothetical protein